MLPRALLLASVVLASLLAADTAFAQAGSRVIVNGDLEFGVPVRGLALIDTDFGFGATFDAGVEATNPWFTSHANRVNGCSATYPFVGVCHPIEVWGNNYDPPDNTAVPANTGVNFVELNAYEAATIYQNVCLIAGESFSYSFAHRRRGTSGSDVARFRIKNQSNGLLQDIVTSTANNASWNVRAGNTTISAAAAGIQRLAFEAVSSSTGNAAMGNLIDSVSIDLTPIADLEGSTSAAAQAEGQDLGDVFVRLNGTSQAGGTVIALQQIAPANGDPLASDADFVLTAGAGATISHTPGTNIWLVTIPAGAAFDGGVVPGTTGTNNPPDGIAIDIDATADATLEPRESVRFQIVAPGGSGSNSTWLSNAPTCTTQTVVTPDYIINGQSQVTLVKVSNGSIGTFDFSFTNADSNLASAGTQASASIATSTPGTPATYDADPVTAGNQGSAIVVPGSAVTITETIPATWSLTSASCVDASNATVATTLAAGVLTIPGSATAATASLTCRFVNTRNADLMITKTNTPGVNGDVDQPGDSIASGSVTTYVLTVRNGGPGAADGALVKDTPEQGLSSCAVVSCTTSGGAVCPAEPANLLTGSGAVIPTLQANAEVVFAVECSVP